MLPDYNQLKTAGAVLEPHSTRVCRAVRSRGCKAKRPFSRQLIFTHCSRQLAISILLLGPRELS